METLTAEQFKKKYGEIGASSFSQPTQPSQDKGYLGRVKESIVSDVDVREPKIGQILNRPDSNILEKGTQIFGQGAGLGAKTIESVVSQAPVLKQGFEKIGEGLNWLTTSELSPIKHLGDVIGSSKTLQTATQLYDTDQNFKDTIDAVANIVRLGGDVDLAVNSANFTRNVTNKVITNAKETIPSVVEPIKAKVSEIKQDAPATIMNRVARLKPTDTTKFERMSGGKTVGDYLSETGNFNSPDKIIANEAKKFVESKNSVDAELDKLKGTYKTGALEDALDSLVEKAKSVSSENVPADYLTKARVLKSKLSNEGLTMSEINEVKRLFERNVKLGYNKLLNADKVEQATNIDDALREWQVDQAKKLGFTNIKELNKQTQLSRFVADKLGDQVVGQSGLNGVNLTDWIVLSGGNPQAIAGFLTKKFFSSKGVQSKIAEMMNDKEIKGIIKPKVEVSTENMSRESNPRGLPLLPENVSSGAKVQGTAPINLGGASSIEPKATEVSKTSFNPKTKDVYVKKGGKTTINPSKQVPPRTKEIEQTTYKDGTIIPKELQPLAQEAPELYKAALNAKSAEEFVKAQQEVAPLGKKLSSEESSVIASSVDLVKVGRGSNETFPNIEIKFVPENQIRNKGIGDYREIPSGGLEVLVSDKLSLLERQKVAVHELVEATLAKKRGISFEEINKFDREHLDAIQPGELKDAPYRNEHLAANEAENIFSKSQLTDLFNKVKGELPVLPKIKDTGFLKTLEKEITKKISAKAPLIRQATRFEKKIEKINTAKDILDNRRSFIKAVQKQFGVTDNELKQITQRDIRLMNNIEFKNHLDNIRVKVEQLAEKRQALNELESTIQTKELQKTENLQKALKLPTIPNMTTNQLRSFNETLSQFKQGDEFLSVRKLETVDKTDLRGIRTLREAKERLAQELGVDISKLDNIKVEALDRYRYDTALAERNPFYGLMVDTVNTSMLNAEARYLKVEEKINSLINAARKSRPQGIVGKFVPQDKQIFQWLESTDEVKKTLQLTNEELEAAQYIQKQYAEMRDYLVQFGTLKKYRQDYVTHINRGFLEEWRETGLLNAFKNVFKNYRREEAIFNIISDTGQILPLEKFFKFSMRRTGGIEPTQNVANAFLSYLKAFEKKAALDSIVPKLDIYAHSLTPKTLTPRGLEFDRSLKTFVNEWLNTKKGRTAKIVGVEQGGKIDLLLRSGKAFTAMLDLGLNIPIGLSARAGENMTNFINLGAKKYANGLIRARTAQGQKIVKDYKNFIGRTPFSELFDARKGLGDKLIDATFGLFQDATVRSNKTFLLGSMTDEEFKAGRITSERLAELKREMGRYRVVEGAKSVVGSTSVGSVLTQYKSWAIPPLRTTIDNVSKIIKNPQLLKAREGQELLRGTLATLSVVFLVKSFVGDDKDESFIGTLINKTYRDAMTLVGSLDPKTITSEPRLVSFISDLGQALSQIIKLEEYSEASKKAGELKGPVSLERALTPRAIKQFIPKEKKEGSIDGLPELPKLPKLPQLPKLPKF